MKGGNKTDSGAEFVVEVRTESSHQFGQTDWHRCWVTLGTAERVVCAIDHRSLSAARKHAGVLGRGGFVVRARRRDGVVSAKMVATRVDAEKLRDWWGRYGCTDVSIEAVAT